MIDGRRVLAIVPARGGSKGLPRKNVRLLGGKPLIAWPIAAAKAANAIDRIVVSTDDTEIAEVAMASGAEVPFMRPPGLATDTATTGDVVLHVLATLASADDSYDYIVVLEPTSPLTEGEDIARALTALHASRLEADAIVGICRVEATHPEYAVKLLPNGLIRPYAAADFRSLRRRQEIEELHFFEGSLYISSVKAFMREKTFYHARTLGYAVPRWKSLEIDEYLDLVCVEAVLDHVEEFKRLDRAH